MTQAPALALLLLCCAAASAQTGKAISSSPGGNLEILEARFGHLDRTCDARPAIGRACDGRGSCRIEAGTRLCGDPVRNTRKALLVIYRCSRGGERLALMAEGERGSLDCGEDWAGGGSSGPPPNWRRDTIYIDSVQYGARGGYCDATRVFAGACDNRGRCQVAVGNRLCGDPARNTPKAAEVRFWCNGARESGRIAEGETAYLSCP